MQLLDSVVEGMLKLPDERDRKDYIYAAVCFLATGELPGSSRPVADAMVTAILPALENSRARAEAGRAGGSKTASRREANAKQNGKQTRSKDASGGAADMEADGKANAKGRGIGRGIGEEGTERGCVVENPPSPDEVSAYVSAQGGYPIDAETFVGHYSSIGWLDPHGRPIVDWRPVALRWSRQDRDKAAREGGGDAYSRL